MGKRFSGIFFAGFLPFLLLILLFSGAYMYSAGRRAKLSSPHSTPLFEDRFGNFLSEGAHEYDRLGFWDVPTPVPERIKACILTVEDRRFYAHPGVDLRAIARAFFANLFQTGRQGASTIAMQVVRMQFPAKRSLWNKAVEMGAALRLVGRFGHDAVLRQYMKIVPQGGQVHGFAYASRRYFRKPLQDLSWTEAALLTSLPRSPETHNILQFQGFLNALSRTRMILNVLEDEGVIDRETYERSMSELSLFPMPKRETRPSHSYHFIFRIIDEFGDDEETSYSRPVRTTLHPEVQDHLRTVASEAIEDLRNYGAGNTAMIVADRKTGEILGYLGSEAYFDEEHSGAINYATVPRSSGSTLKPFLYGLGLDTQKFTPASVIADLPFQVINLSGDFSYSNFDDLFLGPMLYRRALANSRNLPTLRVLESVGLREAYDFFQELGLHDGFHSPDHYGYGLALGGIYVTLENLVRAYGILANDGSDFRLVWFRDNSTTATERSYLSETTARQITLFLSDPLARLPSFPRLSDLEFPFPVAIKTGTSQGFRDAWAVAFSTRYIVGAWIGHPENHGMNHVGSYAAAGMVRKVLLFLQPDESRGINEEPFPPPRDTAAVRICPLSGEVAGDDCPLPALEHFREGTEPHTLCRTHRRYAVDSRYGSVADESTPPDMVVLRAFTVLPPEYAAWGAKHGYLPPPSKGPEVPELTVDIIEPASGSRFIIDPGIPRKFQTFALRTRISPTLPEVVWYVDGEEYERVEFPYETRWPLEEGSHTFQVRFPRAKVQSELVSIVVSAY